MAASAPKTVRTLSGNQVNPLASDNPAVPVNQQTLLEAVVQLQNTVNELIVNHNAHQHSALNAAPATGLVDGNGEAASNLFTAN